MQSVSVCRTCLSSDALRPLFPDNSKYRSFVRALYLCTGLQIERDDGLPQTICKTCAMFIKSAIQFRNKSHASEEKLKKGLNCQEKNYKEENVNSRSTPTDTCTEEKGSIISLIPPQKIEIFEVKTEENSFKFESCADDDNVDSISSINEDTMFKKEQVDIEICLEPMENVEKKKVKVKAAAKKKYRVRNAYMDLVETSNDPENPRQCKLCKKTMKTVMGIKQHIRRHSLGYRCLCDLCGMTHNSMGNLARHQQAMHGLARDDRFPCSYCDYRALDREMLEVHERRTHTKERPFACDDCGEAFYSKRVLKQHFILHTTDRPFQCHICQLTLKSKSRLTGHISMVHKEPKYKYRCPYCPKTFYKNYGARKHIVKVHGIPRDQIGKLAHINLASQTSDNASPQTSYNGTMA